MINCVCGSNINRLLLQVRYSAMLESQMTSTERLFHYAHSLQREEDQVDAADKDNVQLVVDPHWPGKGRLEVRSM